MALPSFTIRQMLEAGVHFGHSTRRWNPKMQPWIFGVRDGIHILDLQQSAPMLYRAIVEIQSVVAKGGRVLFVGTKRQAGPIVAKAAERCGQYYVNHRWLGGMLTNWKTVSNSINSLKSLEKELEGGELVGLTKKEQLGLQRNKDKLSLVLGGIKDMGGVPDLIVVLDANKEKIAIKEANNLNIPVVAILDSNSNPEGVTYPIPGNDDAIRAISFYCDLFADAALSGIQEEIVKKGGDIGEAEFLPEENIEAAKEEVAEKAEVSKD